MNFRKALLAAAALLVVGTGAANANTNYWRDKVTYIANSTNYPSCIMFQTEQTNGVLGMDNSSVGDTGATGYTGTAHWHVIGIGSGTGTRKDQAGFIELMLANSRLSAAAANPVTINWLDYGQNSGPTYGDCNTASTFDAAPVTGRKLWSKYPVWLCGCVY